MDKLIIDPEFRDKIPPLMEEEFTLLEENILSDGAVFSPLIVWDNTILDGHNRYEIIQKHPELTYAVQKLAFDNRYEAISWICKHQLGRRNLTPQQKKYLIGQRYEAEKQVHGGDRKSAGKSTDKICPLISSHQTRASIAQESKVSEGFVQNAANYAKGVDAAEEILPGIKQEILTGAIKPPETAVAAVAKAGPEERPKLAAALKTTKDGRAKKSEKPQPVYTIVEQLKASGVESPERHKRRVGTRTGDNIQGQGWCPSTVRGILQNRAYIGEMICGKSETALYKGLKKQLAAKEDWIVVLDAHPPIVSATDFEAVERQMLEGSAHREASMEWSADIRAGMIDLFAGKIFCADCEKRMYYKRQHIQCKGVVFRGVYDCSTHVRRGHDTCFSHSIRQDVLDKKVFHIVRDQLRVALDYEKLLKAMRGSAGEANIREKYNAAVSSVKLKLNALKKKRTGLYENYVEGILNEEEYAFAKQTYEEQYETLSRLLDEAVERRERFLESISPENKWLTMMRGVSRMTELTQELVDAIIKRVLVYNKDRIEVELNYNDVFEAMCQCVEQMKEAG